MRNPIEAKRVRDLRAPDGRAGSSWFAAHSRRNTDTTSKSMSSGALRRSPLSRERACLPSSLSSPSAVARTLASTTIIADNQREPLRAAVANPTFPAVRCSMRSNNSSTVSVCASSRSRAQQILLQRLACGGGATSKDSMDVLGNIFDLNARHGRVYLQSGATAIKLAPHPKPQVRRPWTALEPQARARLT